MPRPPSCPTRRADRDGAPRARLLALGLALILPLGCVGSIDQPEKGGSGPGQSPGTTPSPGPGSGPSTGPGRSTPGAGGGGGGAPIGTPGADPGDPLAAGVMPLRRLTAHEYDNTVRDLLGDTSAPGKDFPSDHDPAFGFHRPGVVSTLESERLREAAERLAAGALKNLATLLPCMPANAAAEAGCARQFIEKFGLRAYRRPLVAAEIDRLLALYQTGRTQLALPFNESIGLVIEGMLQSSAFLYRWELGTAAPVKEGNVLRLGPYEVASRLSYFLWSTMPDKDLFDAAAANQLDTPEKIATQVRRMLADPKARGGLAEFFEQWLELGLLTDRSKDPAAYPEFTDALKVAMIAETRAFVADVLFSGDGRLSTLLSANHTFADAALAKLYGAAAPAGTGMQKVMLDPNQRAGLLTQASFLAMTGSPEGSNPVIRGEEIYVRLLCRQLPPPPMDVPLPMPASSGGTTRQRFEAHAAQDCASGCHRLFEGFGYAFENYDGIGRFRTKDNNLPVDASGKAELDGKEQTFANARELSKLIAQSPEAQACFAKQLLRFAFRRLESVDDTASINAAVSKFTGASHDIRELLVGFASSRTFRYRSPNPGEVLP